MSHDALTVADHLAIEQLYARQAHAIDSGDGKAWAATFAPDGTFRSPTYDEPQQGREQLRAFAEAFKRSADAAGVIRRHWTCSLEITAAGPERADARCYALVLSVPSAGVPAIERSTVFADRLERVGGAWQVVERQVHVDGA